MAKDKETGGMDYMGRGLRRENAMEGFATLRRSFMLGTDQQEAPIQETQPSEVEPAPAAPF